MLSFGQIYPMTYLGFEATSLRYWLKDPNIELFVRGKGWKSCSQVAVGDVTVFGKVACIGTLDDLRRYWNSLLTC